MSAKPKRSYGAVIEVAGVDPARYVVAATVFRRDGAALSAAELEALAAAMPSVEPRDALPGAEASAPASAPKAPAKKPARAA